MRMLKKKGTDGPIFPWTELLAARSDMEEVGHVTAAPSTAPSAAAAVKGGDGEEGAAAALGVHAITDKAELKRLLKEHGVKVAGNPSLKKLQDALAAAVKGGDGAGD